MTSPTPQPEPTVQSPETIRKALRAVKDPELNLNIVDIGLVYDIESSDEGDVKVKMTLTSPGCPAGGEIIEDVRRVTGDLEGVRNVEVELVWDPTGPPSGWIPGYAPFSGSDRLARAFLRGRASQCLSNSSPNSRSCHRRSSVTPPSSAVVFGSSRAMASSVPLGQTTPGARSHSCASRLRAALSRSSRSSYARSGTRRGGRVRTGQVALRQLETPPNRGEEIAAAPLRLVRAHAGNRFEGCQLRGRVLRHGQHRLVVEDPERRPIRPPRRPIPPFPELPEDRQLPRAQRLRPLEPEPARLGLVGRCRPDVLQQRELLLRPAEPTSLRQLLPEDVPQLRQSSGCPRPRTRASRARAVVPTSRRAGTACRVARRGTSPSSAARPTPGSLSSCAAMRVSNRLCAVYPYSRLRRRRS